MTHDEIFLVLPKQSWYISKFHTYLIQFTLENHLTEILMTTCNVIHFTVRVTRMHKRSQHNVTRTQIQHLQYPERQNSIPSSPTSTMQPCKNKKGCLINPQPPIPSLFTLLSFFGLFCSPFFF